MKASRRDNNEAFVWIWLPGECYPVLAGHLRSHGGSAVFRYDRSYLAREDAIAIYPPELPLNLGELPPAPGLLLHSCLRDAAPDAWGRRVILTRLIGKSGECVDWTDLTEFDCFLESGTDRVGALGFSRSDTSYPELLPKQARLEEIAVAVGCVEHGSSLSPEMSQVLAARAAVGGARPKATIDWEGEKYIAKFPALSDRFPVVKGEFLSMRLAAQAGLDVAPASLVSVAGQEVLLIERFDRLAVEGGWSRRAMVSALTLLGLDEMMARYASYEDLAKIIRRRFANPETTLKELFGRLTFNILIGNTDDHARNHSAFWDGETLQLTPAYDICPQNRTGGEASQAMLILGEKRKSQLAICLEAASNFLVGRTEAVELIAHQIEVIVAGWEALAEEAGLPENMRYFLWGREFLNPFAFQGLDGAGARLVSISGIPTGSLP